MGKKKKQSKFQPMITFQTSDRFSSYPSHGLTPVKLARILREADEGSITAQMELFEEMEEKDPHLFSQLQTRKNAVTGLDFEIIPYSEEEQDKAIAKFVEDELRALEEIEEIFLDLLDAVGKGISISEILWDYSLLEERYHIREILHHHPKNFFWDEKDCFKVVTPEYPSGTELPKGKFIIHKYKARSGHPARSGVLRVCAWMYLFKNYSLKDWSTFAEVYGMPIRLGKYDPSASEEDKRQLIQTLYKIASDAAGIMPTSADIEIKEAQKTDSVEVFERLVRYADEQISKAILGQTLTSDSGGGSYAQSKTHNEVRQDILIADCKALAATLRRDLIAPLVRFNFGKDANIPSIRFDSEDSEDMEVFSKVLSRLVNELGLKISENYVYKKFSIPMPEAGEMTLSGNVPPTLPQTFKQVAYKEDAGVSSQKRIDELVQFSNELSGDLFKEVFAPVRELTENCTSLEEIKEKLNREEDVLHLLSKMDHPKMTDLLEKSLFLSDLLGRMIEHD